MEAQDKPQRGSPLRHPLVTVLVAFLLTGVLGTLLSNYYHNQQADRDRFLDALKIRRAAIRELAGFIYGRRTRAEMLYSSLLRQAPLDEVRERKRLYDQAYAD